MGCQRQRTDYLTNTRFADIQQCKLERHIRFQVACGRPFQYQSVHLFHDWHVHKQRSGTITSGQFDLNNGATASPQTPGQLTGSYTVNTDGRGQLTLNVASANLPNKSSGSLVLSLVLESSARGCVIEVAQNETASGLLQKQAAAPSLAMISGAYATSGFALVYSLPSTPSGPARGDWVGQVTANGAGNITGTVDANVLNSPQSNFPVAGTFALVNGRALGSSSACRWYSTLLTTLPCTS